MKPWIAVLTLLLAAVLGGFAYIGYLGGAVFFDIPAAATACKPQVAAVVLSGDMGFRVGMAPRIAQRLAQEGIPVTGVSSLAYFRKERSPEEAAELIDAAVRRALAHGKVDRVILIGQSFGADMLHVGLARMPGAVRAKILMVGLIVPTRTVLYRASPAELFNWATPDASALDTAASLNWVPTLCLYGEEETDSLCPLLHQPNVLSIALPGGHYQQGHIGMVFRLLRTAINHAETNTGKMRG
jgi:type IV secretory pathway VirJ component